MVRVLAALHLPDAAGPAQHVRPWLAALADEAELEVVAPGGGSALELYEGFAETTVLPYCALTFPRSAAGAVSLGAGLVREVGVFRRHLRERRPDLAFVVTTALPGPLYAARRTRTPTIVYAAELFERAPSEGRLRPRARRAIRDLVSRNASAIVCCSNAVAEQFDAPRVRTIYPGIDPEAPAGDGARFRERYAIPGTAQCVGVAGNIARGRAQDVAIEALSVLAEEHADVRLVLAGVTLDREVDRSYRAGLEDLARRLGLEDRVVFAGFVERMDDFYAAMDVVVNPTRDPEAFGRVAVEALAAGSPVVSTRVPAVPEILTEGEDALLVPADDPAALAAAAARLLADEPLARRLVDRGRTMVAERFSLDRSVAAFLEVVHDLVPAGAR